MAQTDAGPTESPPGIAIANAAVLAALMDTLIAQGVINKHQAFNVVTAAQRQIAGLPDEPFYNDAKFVLRNLTKRFPAL